VGTTIADLMVKVGADLDALDSGMDAGVKTVEKSLDKIEGDADKASASIDKAGAKAAKSFDGLDGAASKAGTALKGIGTDADKAASQVEGAGKQTGDGFVRGVTSGLSGLDSKVSSAAGSAFDKLKGPALAGGAAAGATFMMGLNEVFEREAGTDAVAARLGLSPDASARVGRVSGKLFAGAYGESMEEVGSAVDAVMSTLPGMLGAGDSAIEATTAKALDLATGFGFDVVQGVGLAGVSIRHGLAKDADQAFDLIIASMQKMPAGMREELFPAIEEYGGFLHNMGFTGEEAFGLLAAASHDGMFAIDKTGDAIKELSIRATDMSTLSVDSFKAAGLNAEEMAAKFLTGGDQARGALSELVDGLLGIEDPTKRANAAIGLFGTPLEDLSVTEIPAFLQSLVSMDTGLGDVSGTAEDFGATLNTNAAANIESFKRKALGGLVEFIGGSVIPAAVQLAATYGDDLGRGFKTASGHVKSVVGVLKGNETALKALKVTAVAVLGAIVLHYAAMAVGATVTAVVHGAKVAYMVGRWVFLGAKAAVEAARVVASWALTGAKAVWAGAQHTIAAAKVVAGWVVSGAAALVGGAKHVAGWVMAAAGAVATGISYAVTFAIVVAGWIASGVAAMAGAAVIAAAWLISIWPIALVIAGIALVAAMVVIHFDTIKRWISNVFNWVKDNWPLLLAILTGPFGLAVLAIVKNWDTIKAGATAVKDWIFGRFEDLVGFITGLPGRIGSAASGLWDGIMGNLSRIVDAVWEQIRRLIRAYNSIPAVPNVAVPGGSSGGAKGIGKAHSGEMIPGGSGTEVLRILQGGEEVLSRNSPRNMRNMADIPNPTGVRSAGEGGGGTTVIMNNAGSLYSERDLIRLMQDAIDRGEIRGSA